MKSRAENWMENLLFVKTKAEINFWEPPEIVKPKRQFQRQLNQEKDGMLKRANGLRYWFGELRADFAKGKY